MKPSYSSHSSLRNSSMYSSPYSRGGYGYGGGFSGIDAFNGLSSLYSLQYGVMGIIQAAQVGIMSLQGAWQIGLTALDAIDRVIEGPAEAAAAAEEEAAVMAAAGPGGQLAVASALAQLNNASTIRIPLADRMALLSSTSSPASSSLTHASSSPSSSRINLPPGLSPDMVIRRCQRILRRDTRRLKFLRFVTMIRAWMWLHLPTHDK